MSVKAEKLEKSMVKLTITEPSEKFEEAVKKVYNRQKGRIQIPGFRKGKAPLYIIEKEYGEGIFYEDAANELINETYTEEAKASGEEITSMPKIGIEQIGHGKDFVYTAGRRGDKAGQRGHGRGSRCGDQEGARQAGKIQ